MKKQRSLLSLICLLACIHPAILEGQSTKRELNIQVGPVYNQSSDEFNSTSGLGIYIHSNYFLKENIRLGLGVESTALVWGVLVLPGGCEDEHPRYPGVPSCREGANYLMNNYVTGDYFFGKSKVGKKGGLHRAYVGLSLNLLAHRRYVITSTVPGMWRDTRVNIRNLSLGPRVGYLAGRMDFSISYNKVTRNFRDFVGFRVGYIPWRFQTGKE